MTLLRRVQNIWNKPWVLSVLAGVLLGLSFPPFPFPILSFLGIFLILRIVDLSDSARQAAQYTWVGFIIWNSIVTYWLLMASVAAGAAAILANAAVMTLPVMMQKKTADWFDHPWVTGLLQACWWVSFEYLHHNWDLAWPWLSLGNAWANVPQLVQYISATGYLGISFWVVATSALAYRLLADGSQRKSQDASPALRQTSLKWGALGMLLLFPAVSLIVNAGLPTPDDGPENTLTTHVVQPNFDSYQSSGGHGSPIESNAYIRALSDSLLRGGTELVLWPENGIHPGLSNVSSEYSMAYYVEDEIQDFASDRNLTVIGGATFYEFFNQDELPPLPEYDEDGLPYLTYNAAMAFYPGDSIRVYRKHNLVPIVERMPFARTLAALDILDLVSWSAIQGYGKGWEPTLFSVGNTKVPALICYDSIFPNWVRRFVKGGAGLITVITNDGWWGDTGGHEQHFAYARLRAIEFRRFVVRSANNGISGVIGPDGSLHVRTEYWEKDVFRYEVPIMEDLTFYARFGPWLPWLCLLGGFGSLVWRGVRRFRE
ncbi:MAG: apolipoprotein N-acyltransferase [Balneolaceae bacterium]|nr:apolipoprotein N-acyltransferase [Balneolaceae bacterium]